MDKWRVRGTRSRFEACTGSTMDAHTDSIATTTSHDAARQVGPERPTFEPRTPARTSNLVTRTKYNRRNDCFPARPLLVKTPNRAIVECGGVGYDATISVATFTSLPAEGAEARLHIYTHVREDQIALFGFAEPNEKRMFEKLLTISGIGPKLAITVLSGIDTDRLVTAIRAGDHAHADADSRASARRPPSAWCWS